MMEYVVITDDSESGLEGKVNYQLKQGWKLIGGVSVAVSWDSEDIFHERYAQAMILE